MYINLIRNNIVYHTEKSKSPPREVSTRPTFVHMPRDVTVYAGQDATFTCKIEGKPEPTVKWYVI